MHASEDDDQLDSSTGAETFLLLTENMADLVLFTIEKHEYKHRTTLSGNVREEAISHIGDVLQSKIGELDPLRRELLVGLFRAADEALEEVLQKQQEG